ncbi:hypothetical protein J6590_095720, partial [Homalodisca vitripennis]
MEHTHTRTPPSAKSRDRWLIRVSHECSLLVLLIGNVPLTSRTCESHQVRARREM